MTPEDKVWFELWDSTHLKFRWFFFEYGYKKQWHNLLEQRKVHGKPQMLNIMNGVWFHLPDSVFNIKVMPKGWREFLNLIEE